MAKLELEDLFSDKALLIQALTHRSWVNEHKGERESNERLEFLGDAVLEFIVSDALFRSFPEAQEGYLTALRANLVNTQNLASVATRLALGVKLYLSKGEEDGGGRDNSSLLADTVEAVIGALFVDQGLGAVKKFIEEHLLSELPAKLSQPLKDAKSRLQEAVQSQGLPTPRYVVQEESGPDHAKSFKIEVYVGNKKLGEGQGKSKSEAEQDAATNALGKNLVNSGNFEYNS